jgi:hypothetical protein
VIAVPRRPMTRFLIPLIDVLILLFGLFLLMPYVEAERTASTPQVAASVEPARTATGNPFETFAMVVLEIDRFGELSRYEESTAERIALRNRADALRLLDRERETTPGRALAVLILYPRELTGYPLRRQVESFREWFQDVPVAFDSRRAGGLR